MKSPDWMRFENEADVPSPALVLHLERIQENLRRMVALIGDPARLCPHLKTHKLPQILALQLALGITKCKAATIAEAEMAAAAGVPDVLLATQPVGPAITRLIRLIQTFPQTRFSALCDTPVIVAELGHAAVQCHSTLELLVDLDVGQARTGITPGQEATQLARQIHSTPGLRFGGLHAYDGHLHQSDLAERTSACHLAFEPVWTLRESLLSAGLPVPRVVVGGTPTFAIHARRPDVECSPGTCVLWDAGYGTKLPDLDFLPAATLLARVISHPGKNRLCLDLGHKAVASEMQHPRVVFPVLPEATVAAHNEEHLVLETPMAGEFPVGTVLHGIPWHVCPTVALHQEAIVVQNGKAGVSWPVVGRARRITI
ncbi:MAG: D-TA family PLP-dependent enzyme [Verrucomicrobiota bacterium]